MNNATLLILEFIQTTGLMLYAKRYPLYAINSTNSYVRIYKLFMQNKPNSPNVQISLTSFIIMFYIIFISLTKVKNKANSNPNKPNLRKAKMNVNLYVIEDYRKKDDFLVRINKPNFVKGPK